MKLLNWVWNDSFFSQVLGPVCLLAGLLAGELIKGFIKSGIWSKSQGEHKNNFLRSVNSDCSERETIVGFRPASRGHTSLPPCRKPLQMLCEVRQSACHAQTCSSLKINDAHRAEDSSAFEVCRLTAWRPTLGNRRKYRWWFWSNSRHVVGDSENHVTLLYLTSVQCETGLTETGRIRETGFML